MSLAAILTLTAFVLAAFVLSLLSFAGERRQATFWLAALLGLICLVAAMRFSILSDSDWMLYLPYITLPLAFAHGPIVYLYTRAGLFQEHWRSELRRIWFAAIPIGLVLGVHIFVSLRFAEYVSKEAIRNSAPAVRVYVGVFLLLGFFYMQAWVVAAFRELGRYRREFEERFSTEAAEEVRWTRFFLIVCAVWFAAPLILAPLTFLYPGRISFANSPITIVPLVIIIYLITQHVLVRPRALTVASREPSSASTAEPGRARTEARYAKIALSAEKRRELAESLRDSMERDQLYLDAELSLPRLAQELDVPAHHLSMVISLDLKMNFHGLVSLYRVREAARLLRDPDHGEDTILDIGFRAGFNSKAALNRAFKQHTGATPRDFRVNGDLALPELPRMG